MYDRIFHARGKTDLLDVVFFRQQIQIRNVTIRHQATADSRIFLQMQILPAVPRLIAGTRFQFSAHVTQNSLCRGETAFGLLSRRKRCSMTAEVNPGTVLAPLMTATLLPLALPSKVRMFVTKSR